MSHPLVPTIVDLATPIARDLNLEVVAVTFHTNQNPPVLRVDVRNPNGETGLDDCERMSRALDASLDDTDAVPDAYVLEVSSPGLSSDLTSDREFISFKGFDVIVTASEPYKGKLQWTGTLLGRDDTTVRLSQKGRPISIPRTAIARVCLTEAQTE